MAELIPGQPEPREEGLGKLPAREPARLIDESRRRFRELAAECVGRCAWMPDKARAVLHSLELGFAQLVKEEGAVMQRQFGSDVEAAVGWAAEQLAQAGRQMAADVPGQRRSSLQGLALLEVQALELMLPAPAQNDPRPAAEAVVPAAQLRSFCARLNDALDLAHKADDAADRHDQHGYESYYVRSRNKLRMAARTLRQMSDRAAAQAPARAVELCGFQLELAAIAGSIRWFLKALRARDAAVHASGYRPRMLDPHCLIGDLLPILFDRHFAFTIRTPRGIPGEQAQQLMTAAHETLWQHVVEPIAVLLAHPSELTPADLKQAVEVQLRKAIEVVNAQFAPQRVVISITSTHVREIRRRDW